MKKRFAKVCVLIAVIFAAGVFISADGAAAEEGGRHLRILFTSDMHDYYIPARGVYEGMLRDHGGAARMKTLIDEYSDDATIVVDAGDFSMGTLLGAGFATDAFELRLMGAMGIQATTLGNHEFDFGPEGLCAMLDAAKASGDILPAVVQSSLSFSEPLTDAQRLLKARFDAGQIAPSATFRVNGLNVAVFAVMGEDSVDCSPTSGQNWQDQQIAARTAVEKLQGTSDVLICLSHGGTESPEKGEDIDLARNVSGIDVLISGHAHQAYAEATLVNGTILGSCGSYNAYLGLMDLTVSPEGDVALEDYRLIPCDGKVYEDPQVAAMVEDFCASVEEGYLAPYGFALDTPLCFSGYDMMPLEEMYATHQEYPLGDLIADAYMYEAAMHGIDDIDAAIVALGTIRGTIHRGPITAENAFEICSLGVGENFSAGHPLVCGYLSGKELKLLAELDASLGPVMPEIKMSYSGLNYRFNSSRVILDRVTTIGLERPGSMLMLIEDDRLYKVCCNLYAANLLGKVNGLTKGILSITPKNADGSPIVDLASCALKDEEGCEIKEWVAFADYLRSFRVGSTGLPELPDLYRQPQSRKVRYTAMGFSTFNNPGPVTRIAIAAAALLIVILALAIWLLRKLVRRVASRGGDKA
ncbi:MAG: bifunctional metallophosphatase/5'-nucleotidase [Clostridia bacterium]|nr:bifunctional metallophosphatase/5'-nucleotidase [Clostridia bacterium]